MARAKLFLFVAILSRFISRFFRLKKLIKREEEKSKREEAAKAAQMGQALTTKEPEGYAECYPGMSEMNDAIDDSDDEVDYSKMDLVSLLCVSTRTIFVQ